MKKKRIFLSPPHMGGEELRFIQEAFESNYIAPVGPMVDAFEREFSAYTGIRHCVAVSSGTAAMHLALRLMEVGPGDEVFASTLTFIGGVTPIVYQGATPVFIDCDRNSWNMDPDLLAEELESCARKGKLPKAVVPTDLYGQCADYERIFGICENYGVPVVVDAAEALGARYELAADERRYTQIRNISSEEKCADEKRSEERFVRAGVGARAAVFSFNGNKIITTSNGGMLASDDKALIDQARLLSQQARDPFPHYEHSQIGYNYRMSNVLAAVGRGQLSVLEERVKRKREICRYYKEALAEVPGIEFMPEAGYGISNRWLTVILVTPDEFGVDREMVRLALEAENVEARPVWKPMHLQPVFSLVADENKKLAADERRLTQIKYNNNLSKNRVAARVVGGEVAEDLFERGLCLPSGTGMVEEDLERVVMTVKRCRG